MTFTSIKYLIFLALAALVHRLLPRRLQNGFLLLASLAFYMWAVPEYGVLVLFTVGLCYGMGLLLERLSGKKRSAALAGAVVLLLGVLFLFKYYNFFLDIIASLVGFSPEGARLSLVLPVGISFYTFTVIGYLVDVKTGKVKAERSFIDFALFVTFFPAILSGPIARSHLLLPQLKAERQVSAEDVREAMQRFLLGAFRKVVLADGIGILISPIIADPYAYSGIAVMFAIVFYSFMVYWDFAGYSDMAVASGRLFGIRLIENFRVPLLATDMAGFWKRWHISLTSWLTDYVFTPLVWSRWGNKLLYGKKWEETKPVALANIVIVFLISGIWHGAGMGYILWGLAHGIIRVAEDLVLRHRKKHKIKPRKTPLAVALRVLKVNIIAIFTLLLFSQNAPALIGAAVQNLAPSVAMEQLLYLASNMISATSTYILLYLGILGLGMALGAWMDIRINRSGVTKDQSLNPLSGLGLKVRWAVYWFMGLATAWFYVIGQTSGAVSFVYFGF